MTAQVRLPHASSKLTKERTFQFLLLWRCADLCSLSACRIGKAGCPRIHKLGVKERVAHPERVAFGEPVAEPSLALAATPCLPWQTPVRRGIVESNQIRARVNRKSEIFFGRVNFFVSEKA